MMWPGEVVPLKILCNEHGFRAISVCLIVVLYFGVRNAWAGAVVLMF